jgi:DNA-binding beta-propeller fold protein YncE
VFVIANFLSYGCDRSSSSVLVLDARTGHLVRTIRVPAAAGTRLDRRNHRLFVNSASCGALTMLDTRDGHVLGMLQLGPAAGDMFLDEQHGRLLVSVRGPLNDWGNPIGPGHLAVLDAQTGTVLRTVEAGWNPTVIAVDDRTGRALVLEAGVHLQPGEPALSRSDPLGWLPQWLRGHLPLPSSPGQARIVPARLTLLDNLVR